MMAHRLTPLTESGILAALAVVLGLMAAFLPVIGVVAVFLWALPLLVLTVRQGVRLGAGAAAASSAVLSLFAGPLLALRMCVAFAPVGLVLGWGIRRGWSGTRTFLAGLVSSVASKLAAFFLLFFVMGIDPWQAQLDGLTQAFSSTLSMYEDMGLDAAAVAQSRDEIETALAMIGKLAPLVMLIMGFSDTVVLFLLGGRVLRRLGSAAPQLPPFSAWRLPVSFLYLFGFSLVGLYWGGTRELPAVYTAALNANMAAMLAGGIQGLSLLSVLLGHFRLKRGVRILIYVFVVFNGLLLQIVAFTGLIDMFFDYRRRFAGRAGGR